MYPRSLPHTLHIPILYLCQFLSYSIEEIPIFYKGISTNHTSIILSYFTTKESLIFCVSPSFLIQTKKTKDNPKKKKKSRFFSESLFFHFFKKETKRDHLNPCEIPHMTSSLPKSRPIHALINESNPLLQTSH